MEIENKDCFLEFDKIEEVVDDQADIIITKGLYLDDAIETNNLSVVDDLVVSIMELTKEKEKIKTEMSFFITIIYNNRCNT